MWKTYMDLIKIPIKSGPLVIVGAILILSFNTMFNFYQRTNSEQW